MQERLVAIACVLAVIAVSAVSGSDETGAARRRSDGSKGSGEWRITLYTGNKLWAGTDSDLYVELIGTNGNSNIIRLQPRPSQLEADDVDTFPLGTLEGRDIGALKQIVVAKQHSYAFFNDWELVKAEVHDPNGRKYIFRCNCWLTTLKYKRLIDLSEIEGERPIGLDSDETLSMGTRSTRVFPLTITILFLLLVLITFTYFGNEICKKWRDNFLFFNSSSRAAHSSLSSHRSEIGGRSRSPGGRVGNVGVDPEQAVNVLLTPNMHQLSSIIEDKPPDYKALFPNNNPQHITAIPMTTTTTGEQESAVIVTSSIPLNTAATNVTTANSNVTSTDANSNSNSNPQPPNESNSNDLATSQNKLTAV